jgi:signal transduction histidine kinase
MERLLIVVVVLAGLAGVAIAIRERRGSLHARRASAVLSRSVNEFREQIRSLDEAARAMETVLSSMEEGVVLAAPDGRIRLTNPAAERHLGARPSSLSAVLPLSLQDAARTATAERHIVSVEAETGAPSRWLRASAIPVGDDGSMLLVVRDVTEAKLLEAVRRDFVANASHELKTPAASIQATAETIRTAATQDPTVVPRFAEQLDREAIRLSRIVSDLLDLSRLETGSNLDETVAVDGLLREEAERFERAASEASVGLTIHAETAVRVRGSARDLSLLIRNLVDNAIRYTRAGGRVDVGLACDGGHAVLTVADTGIGIPTRDLPRIFERFYRVDRARSRETGGTGLGLSIVRHIVENHHGTVSVTSELGRGTTFVIRLPTATSG